MTHNAFQELVNITENKWYDIVDFSVMAGFQLKLAGHDWRTNKELIAALLEMVNCGFLEVDNTNQRQVKIQDIWYGNKSI